MKMIILGISLMMLSCQNNAQNTNKSNSLEKIIPMEKQTIYQFKVTDINGDEFNFASLKGKKILIVNTASKCGYTSQYKDLEALYEKYKNKNFVIVGFPANNFLWQEPGTNAEIATFCQKNYGVTFPMMGKISVKGDDMHPLYKFLTQMQLNGVLDSKVKWNFQKYLINEKGELEQMYLSGVEPTDAKIVNWIEN
jgi:glutathione peroxidase